VSNGFSDATILDFVEHIYAAGSDPSGWARFVNRVHEELPGTGFSCQLSIAGTGLVESTPHAGYDPDSIRSLLAHYQHINPYDAIFKLAPVRKVIKATGLVTRDWLEGQVFYHEWLKPAGNFTHGANITMVRDACRLLRIAFDIPDHLGHLEETCAQLLGRLGPHLARAFELNERLEAAVATQNALDAMLARIDGAAAILGPHAQVLSLNARAEALARAATLVRITPARRLTFCKADDETAFQRALAAALGVAVGSGPWAFAVEDKTGPAHAVVLPLRAASGTAAPLAGPRALLVIRAAGTGVTAPADLLRSLYCLTPAEAALVLQIAAGLSVAEAADALGVTRTTARNQLAAAMVKLDVHRQAELVGLVAGLAPRLDVGVSPARGRPQL
jgi:DNA-binding CsgD family transcriptional regulator